MTNPSQQTFNEIPPWVFGLLNLADMVGPVSHDLKNVLNNIVLQSAGLARAVPVEFRERVAAFRKLAASAGQMLGQLDTFRRDLVAVNEPVDVAVAVTKAVQHACAAGLRVEAQLAHALPLIQGNGIDLARLLNLLIATGHSRGAPVVVGACSMDDCVSVSIEDAGPPASPEGLQAYFEPFGFGCDGRNNLERAAAAMIARRLRSTLEATNQPGQGVVVAFKLPAWKDTHDAQP